nr:LamG domain-containing protein [Thermoplasmata archaeon]NIS12821.1 LamG domain-containing protein [Thermoplasmata archaeon]NIS20725.1 LamG domain-containing protein [Thermoplasmata archaeon]NIT78129.1 LamG domain-containing protein [Thermoplasmata archaeon]NIU49797.1 LamG domain-containing protein [Thermoplasmata archaeon]
MTRPTVRKALSTAVMVLLVLSGIAGCIPPAAADGVTSTVESDARGGSWIDTFGDGSGIDWGKSNNVTVANGTVAINGTYDAKTSNNGTWHLNTGSGTTAYDGSVNGNNGTLKNGVSWTTGKYGSALKFDGSNDYVDLSHDKAFDMSGDLSIQLWVNKSTDVSYAGIVGRWDWNAYNLMLTNDGKKMRMEFMKGGTNYDTFDDTTAIPNGRWVHLAATFNDTADKLRFYVDGKLSSTHSASNSYVLTSTSGLVFGSQSPSINRYFSGSMDEIELFDTPLTDTEVNESYKNGPYSVHNYGNITSKQITVPSGMIWETLVINKTSGSDQVLNVTVLNSAGTRTIMGTSTYATGGEFDISSIDASKYPTIRLNATFEDNGFASPMLHYWGVSWRASNAWRDTLFGGQKVTSSKDVEVLDGNVTLKAGSFPTGAVAVWQCNEGSGTKVGDGTTNGHNGTTQGGASWTTGKFGKALSLDGTDDYATVKDNDDFDFGTGEFTILAWVKTSATTTTGSGRDDILVKGDPTISGYSLSARSNVATFFIANSGALYGTTNINDGKWHHLAGTRDSSGNTVLYLDGSSEATGSNSENVDTSYDVHLGRHGTKQESYFDGALDDMAVFNKALSSTVIKDIYKNGYGMVSDTGNILSKPITVPAAKT